MPYTFYIIIFFYCYVAKRSIVFVRVCGVCYLHCLIFGQTKEMLQCDRTEINLNKIRKSILYFSRASFSTQFEKPIELRTTLV